jgi:hypothetical protein
MATSGANPIRAITDNVGPHLEELLTERTELVARVVAVSKKIGLAELLRAIVAASEEEAK